MFPRQGVQGVAVSLVDVVNCEVELEGWKDVPGVHGHLVLASDQRALQVVQLLLQLLLEKVEVVIY